MAIEPVPIEERSIHKDAREQPRFCTATSELLEYAKCGSGHA